MVQVLSFSTLLICLCSGGSANWAQIALPKSDNFPEPPHCGFGKIPSSSSRIFGGVPVKRQELPWMVYFSMGCGGTLINSRWVLTAAHCFHPDAVEQSEIDNAKAFINALDCVNGSCDSNATEVKIAKYIRHEEYDRDQKINDIALIQLKDAVTFNDEIQPICLPYNDLTSGSTIFGKQAHVSGWGETEHNVDSIHLLKTELKIWHADKCERFLDPTQTKREFHICAGEVAGKDSCAGDSGGPLYMHLPLAEGSAISKPYYQVGIASFGPKPCGQVGLTQIYTNVSTYIPWIRSTILSHE